MSAHYTIRVDTARDLVEITMSGFFTPEDVAEFVRARDDAHRQLTCAPNTHVTLNDISQMKVQAQEIVGAFQSVLATPSARSRRLAFVVSRTLARTQVVRALNGRDAQCFEDRASAEAWLFKPDRRVAA